MLSAATVKPEDVRHVEVGVKTEPFRGVTANVTVFNTEIKDFQTQVVNASVGVLRGYLANAEKVRVRGAEFDGNARVQPRLSFYGAAAYTDGSYVSFPDAPPPLEETGGPQVKDISGSVLPGISKWALVVRRRVRAGRGVARRPGEFFGAVDTSYRSSFSSSASASRYLMVDGYSLVNARVGFRWADGWSLSVWARNLFDKDYFELLTAAPGNSGLYRRSAGRPAHGRRHAADVARQVAGLLAEQLAVGACALAVDLFRRGAQPVEQIFDERQRHLALTGIDGVGAGVVQAFEIAQVDGAGQDSDRRIQGPRRANHLGAVGHAGRGQNQTASRGHSRPGQRVRPCGVTVDRVNARRAQFADGFDVEIDHGWLDAVLSQQPRDGPARRTIADDHGPVTGAGQARGMRLGLEIHRHPRRALQAPQQPGPACGQPDLDWADRPVKQRVDDDRQDRRGDQGVRGGRRQDAQLAAERADRMNENSPICASAIATGERRRASG